MSINIIKPDYTNIHVYLFHCYTVYLTHIICQPYPRSLCPLYRSIPAMAIVYLRADRVELGNRGLGHNAGLE